VRCRNWTRRLISEAIRCSTAGSGASMRARCTQASTAARTDVPVRHRLWAARVASARSSLQVSRENDSDQVHVAQDPLLHSRAALAAGSAGHRRRAELYVRQRQRGGVSRAPDGVGSDRWGGLPDSPVPRLEDSVLDFFKDRRRRSRAAAIRPGRGGGSSGRWLREAVACAGVAGVRELAGGRVVPLLGVGPAGRARTEPGFVCDQETPHLPPPVHAPLLGPCRHCKRRMQPALTRSAAALSVRPPGEGLRRGPCGRRPRIAGGAEGGGRRYLQDGRQARAAAVCMLMCRLGACRLSTSPGPAQAAPTTTARATCLPPSASWRACSGQTWCP
jgi:hypothetical protein